MIKEMLIEVMDKLEKDCKAFSMLYDSACLYCKNNKVCKELMKLKIQIKDGFLHTCVK